MNSIFINETYNVIVDFDRSINWSSSDFSVGRFWLVFDVCKGETVAIGFVKRVACGFVNGNDDDDDDKLFVGVNGSSAAKSLFASWITSEYESCFCSMITFGFWFSDGDEFNGIIDVFDVNSGRIGFSCLIFFFLSTLDFLGNDCSFKFDLLK